MIAKAHRMWDLKQNVKIKDKPAVVPNIQSKID